MSAARHADALFVKIKPGGDNDLSAYCKREGIPHVLFTNFLEALTDVKSIVNGERTKEDVLANGQKILEDLSTNGSVPQAEAASSGYTTQER